MVDPADHRKLRNRKKGLVSRALRSERDHCAAKATGNLRTGRPAHCAPPT
jgi:hypothetical protein